MTAVDTPETQIDPLIQRIVDNVQLWHTNKEAYEEYVTGDEDRQLDSLKKLSVLTSHATGYGIIDSLPEIASAGLSDKEKDEIVGRIAMNQMSGQMLNIANGETHHYSPYAYKVKIKIIQPGVSVSHKFTDFRSYDRLQGDEDVGRTFSGRSYEFDSNALMNGIILINRWWGETRLMQVVNPEDFSPRVSITRTPV